MSGPSIKGSVIEKLVEDARRLRDNGRVSSEYLEVRLDRVALELLDSKPLPALWYPLESYDRLIDLLLEVEGKGSPDYLRRRGAGVADRLIAGGFYDQFSSLDRRLRDPQEYLRLMRRVVAVMGAIFNFVKWDAHPDPGQPRRVVIELSEADDFTEHLCRVTEGFLTRIAQERGLVHSWQAERTAPDRVVCRMDRDLDA
jgi:hypothetical protein